MTKLVYMLRSGRLQYAAFRIPNIHDENMIAKRDRLDSAFVIAYCGRYTSFRKYDLFLGFE